MTAANASITNLGLARSGLLKKVLLFLLFFVVEAMVFAILPLSAFLPVDSLLNVQVGLTAILLVAAFLLRRSERGRPYWPLAYAFFVAALAVVLSTLYQGRLLRLLNLPTTTPQGLAVVKFSESVWRVVPILFLMAIVGMDWRSIYLQKGRLGLGLGVGAAGFAAFFLLAFLPMASQPGGLNKLLPLLPWILLFVLSNGFNEELLCRGIFLKKYEAFLGKGLANVLAALVFTLLHFQAGYVADVVQFLVILFPLALVWGWLMQKTDSLWGSALFHAGADCMIIFGVFASLGAT